MYTCLLCRGSLSFFDCIEADVTDHCNDSTAGHWQRGLDERQLSSLLVYVGCVVEGCKDHLISTNPLPADHDYTCRQINQDCMIFGDFSANSEPFSIQILTSVKNSLNYIKYFKS